MASPRLRRLTADLAHMNELAARNPAISFRAEGNPPETYDVMIHAVGIARDASGQLVLRGTHRCRIYLHTDYPRRPPVVTWLTPILHPNILPPERNGGVCLGAWSASESIADLVTRLADLAAYRSFNADDALDKSAAAWVKAAGLRRGVDLQALFRQNGEQIAGDEGFVVTVSGSGSS